MTTYRRPITPTDIIFAFPNETERMTRRQIAEAVGRKPHDRLNRMIDSLVDEGYLKREVDKMPNGVDVFLYHRPFPLDEV